MSMQKFYHRQPKLSVSMADIEYKDLYGNPDKKLQKIILWKKSQLRSQTLLSLWVASFLCGYLPDPMQFEPFFNFWVVNSYGKIPRLETKFSGATNLSQIFLDKMFPRSQFHIYKNQLIKIELSSQLTINAIAVLRATSGCNIAIKQLLKELLYHQSGHGFGCW